MAAMDFPANPTNGQTYNGYVYSTSIGAWQAKPAAQSPFYTSDTPPANPVTGDSWFNTNDGTMYIYMYDGNTYQWVEHRSQIAKSQVGLVPIVPTSIVVGSGSASYDVAGTITYTGSSYVMLNGVFTSTYRNYRILLNVNSASSNYDIFSRFSTSGTMLSSGYYAAGHRTNQSNTSSAYGGVANGSEWYIVGGQPAYNTGTAVASIDIYNPFISTLETHARSIAYGTNPDATGFSIYNTGTASTTGSRDGIVIAPNAGTINGTMKVYGYN